MEKEVVVDLTDDSAPEPSARVRSTSMQWESNDDVQIVTGVRRRRGSASAPSLLPSEPSEDDGMQIVGGTAGQGNARCVDGSLGASHASCLVSLAPQ